MRTIVACFALVAGCDSCGAKSSAPASSTASAPASSTAPAPASGTASAPTSSIAITSSAKPPSLTRLPCRVLGPAPPSTPASAGDFMWLEIAGGARVTAKDPTTARETTFEGPARVRLCVEGEEETWLSPLAKANANGAFVATRGGGGESPGAEEWLITPVGVVRYVSAAAKVTVGIDATIQLTSGTIDVWPAGDARVRVAIDGGVVDAGARSDEGWRRFDGGAVVTIAPSARERALTPGQAAAEAQTACLVAARDATSLARAIAAPDASLASLAPKHVVARRLARAACAVARVRASALPADSVNASLATAAASADRIWRGLGDVAEGDRPKAGAD